MLVIFLHLNAIKMFHYLIFKARILDSHESTVNTFLHSCSLCGFGLLGILHFQKTGCGFYKCTV